MREVEFRIPPSAQLTYADSAIESACLAEGLEIGMKKSLASFPGSMHWHFRSPSERGTLEITFSPRDRRIWASIQDSRRAVWIDPCLAKIKRVIENNLKQTTIMSPPEI
jgi:hypothetical protein